MKYQYLFLVGLLLPLASLAQPPVRLTYAQYLDYVLHQRLELTAQAGDLAQAGARLKLAQRHLDPTLTLGNASGDITGQRLQQQFYGGITFVLPTAGKRPAAIAAAVAEQQTATADRSRFVQQFRLEASRLFVDAFIAQQIYRREKQTYDLLETALLQKEKTVTGIELTRLQVEAGQVEASLLQAEANLHDAQTALALTDAAQPEISGSLEVQRPLPPLDSLLSLARQFHPDLVVQQAQAQPAPQQIRLAKALRRPDLELSLGNNYYTLATNETAPTPAYHAITALVSIPLPFSNRNRSDLDLTTLVLEQQHLNTQALLARIANQVRRNYDRCQRFRRQIQLYTGGLLAEAEKLLESDFKAYQRGTATFLDLSESHRKLNEVYYAYYEALREHAYALAELEYASGDWKLEF